MTRVAEAVDPDRLSEFLEFTRQRHQVWEKRQLGLPYPWTDHPALRERKFTNVYRVLDYGSQWLFNSGWIDGEAAPRDQLMRLFLYRHTGRWEAWDTYLALEGEPPTVDDLDTALAVIKSYRGKSARPVFTSAYLVFPQSTEPGTDKLDSIFALTRRLFTDGSPDDVVPDFLKARSQAERFKCLRRNKGVADFMSMQILTDWGYTPHCGEDREDEFVVCGPGARKGSAALAPGARPEDVVRWALDTVRSTPGCPKVFIPHSMNVRPPSLMDVQNLLCEFSKLVRYVPKGVPYVPSHPGSQDEPSFPSHW